MAASIVSCNGSQSVTVVQNDSPASVSGVNRKMTSGIRIAGRLPNRMSSTRVIRTPAAASAAMVTRAASSQSYGDSRVTSQNMTRPPGLRWPPLKLTR
jgi:hypothetical protein